MASTLSLCGNENIYVSIIIISSHYIVEYRLYNGLHNTRSIFILLELKNKSPAFWFQKVGLLNLKAMPPANFFFSTSDMQTSPPFRSGYLDKKYVQSTQTKEVLKNILSRFRVMGVQKGRYGCPKIRFAKFVRNIGIHLTLIFHVNDFFFDT